MAERDNQEQNTSLPIRLWSKWLPSRYNPIDAASLAVVDGIVLGSFVTNGIPAGPTADLISRGVIGLAIMYGTRKVYDWSYRRSNKGD